MTINIWKDTTISKMEKNSRTFKVNKGDKKGTHSNTIKSVKIRKKKKNNRKKFK